MTDGFEIGLIKDSCHVELKLESGGMAQFLQALLARMG